LHLTFGGSPALRISATTTSMPREAKSIAAVNPTGPAPTTRTWVCILSITSLGWPDQAQSGCAQRATLDFIAGTFGYRNILQVPMVQISHKILILS